MVHNCISIFVRNWYRILGKQNLQILNILNIDLPDKEIYIVRKISPLSQLGGGAVGCILLLMVHIPYQIVIFFIVQCMNSFNIQILEFDLARSLRGLCKNKRFLSCTPARCEILWEKNGLSSLTRNITARPCKTLFLPNLTGPKGGARTLRKGGRASLLGSHNFLQDQNYFSTMC
jgi:hypothetical protein